MFSFVSLFKNNTENQFDEEGYIFSQIKSSIFFIENLSEKRLIISTLDYEK